MRETPVWGFQPGHQRIIVDKLMATWQTHCHRLRHAHTHTLYSSISVCALTTISVSLLPCLDPCLLSSLCPPLCSAVLVSVSLSASCLSHAPKAVWVCACKPMWCCSLPHAARHTVHSSPSLAMLQPHNSLLIRKNGLIRRWEETLMKVRDRTSPLCLNRQLWGHYNSLRPNLPPQNRRFTRQRERETKPLFQ